jgi:glycine/D-amino acid oxidase-like deaminating enzyme
MTTTKIDSSLSPSVLIVGGGVAGCSTALALWRAGVRDITLLERGELGVGVRGATHAQRSGSAVVDAPSRASRIKMIVTLFASSVDAFVAHHGERGARLYLRAAARGVALECALARDVGADCAALGSLYVADADAAGALDAECAALQRLGVDCALLDADATQRLTGAAHGAFARAIRFPHDAVIDSSAFCRLLLERGAPGVRVVEHCSPVLDVVTTPDGRALATLADGSHVRAHRAVVATGGLFVPPALAGMLTPCYSYLAAIPMAAPAPADSPNFFTWGFTHDWCFTRGALRCSGADHFSALKAPRDAERCGALADWCEQRYPRQQCQREAMQTQYGVYSETPDKVPLVGPLWPGSAVHYIVGCNAWGQAILSAAAASMPAIMGLADWAGSEQREEFEELLSIRRFTHHQNFLL